MSASLAATDDCLSADVPERDLRGWSVRYGHRRRLARNHGRESHRGRTTFARSVNAGSRWGGSERSWVPRQAQRLGRWSLREEIQTVGVAAGSLLEIAGVYVESEPLESHWDAVWAEEVNDFEEWSADDWWMPLDDAASYISEVSMAAVSVASACSTVASAPSRAKGAARGKEGAGAAVAPLRRSRWEEAQARAAAGREKYARLLKERAAVPATAVAERKTKPAAAAAVDHAVLPPVHGYPALDPGALVGRPFNVPMHDRVLKCAARSRRTGMPSCWDSRGGSSSVRLCPSDEEYQAVADYFLQSVQNRARDPEIVSLERLQNDAVYARYAPEGSERETVMFHGCRTAANEASIVEDGFQVRRCVSGGVNFGTWFAYSADYSHGGYVFAEASGIRHIFVCVVSNRYVVRDNATMRVVAQDCAYPLWLLCYTCASPPPPPPRVRSFAPSLPITVKFVSVFSAVRRKRRRNPTVKVFHEVRDGRWVKVTAGGLP